MAYGFGSKPGNPAKFSVVNPTGTTYRVDADDAFIFFADAEAKTIHFPKADANGGRILHIFSQSGAITVTPDSGDSIAGGDADATASVNQNTQATFVSNGVSNWHKINNL